MKSIFTLFFTLFLFQNLSSQCVATGYNSGDLITCTSSYLGGDGIDAGTSIKILGNGDVVIAGTFNAIPSATNSYNYLSATSTSKGMVLIFNATGTVLKTAIRLGDAVDDMDVNRSTNEIYTYGSFGLVKLNATGASLLWSKTESPVGTVVSSGIYSSGRRVAVADNGDVVILGNSGTAAACNGFVYVYNSSGNPISTGNFTMPRTDIGGGTYNEKWEDIAIDSSSKQLFVTGMAQRCSTYQSSFLISYSYNSSNFGTKLWQSFTLWCSGATTYSLTADARGKRVEFKNGELLFVGHADGGNNLFTKTVNDYTTNEPNLVTIDRWNNGAGFGSGKVGYFARINPTTGLVIKSQFQFSSTGVNQAKSYEILGITSRNTGEILIGGISNKDMPNRTTLKINGTSVGPRVDDESSFIGVSAGLNTRNWVATYTNAAGTSKIVALDSHDGVIALLGECEGNIMTHNAIDNSKATGTDVFFSIFGNDTSLAVDNINQDKLVSLYPNPSNGKFFLNLKEPKEVEIQIFSLVGKLLFEKKFETTNIIPIEFYQKGLYLINIKSDKMNTTSKIIIQ